jgi:hypothetical protein
MFFHKAFLQNLGRKVRFGDFWPQRLGSMFRAICTSLYGIWRIWPVVSKVSLNYYHSIFVGAIFCTEVKVIYIPQYESLKLDLILEFALTHQSVIDSLPVLREIRKMPRSYICNVIFTRLGSLFGTWVE